MPADSFRLVLDRLRRSTLLREAGDVTDGELLGRYVARRDEAAFEALVRRHGPMVLGVCRRVLGNPHDADDAFQATFLVLAKKAASVRPRDKVAGWLYGVAYRAALKARAVCTRRRAREKQVRVMPEPATVAEGIWHDLEPLLDGELSRLPDAYRFPIVLCDLEGKTRKEAARLLGWPEGTVAGRLARGRALLAKRLTRAGVPLSGGVLAAVLAPNTAPAAVPASLVSVTVANAAAGAVPAPVAAITEGVLKAMLLAKLKIATVLLLAAALVGVGVGLLPRPARAQGPRTGDAARELAKDSRKASARWSGLLVKNATLEGVEAAQRFLTIVLKRPGTSKAGAARTEGELKMAAARLEVAAVKEARIIKLAEVKAVAAAAVDEAKAYHAVAKADLARVERLARLERGTRMEGLPVAKDARITIRGKAAKLADLKAGMRLSLRLASDGDQLVVTEITAGN